MNFIGDDPAETARRIFDWAAAAPAGWLASDSCGNIILIPANKPAQARFTSQFVPVTPLFVPWNKS